ncbi:MAG: hypothetical protein IRY99_02600, partial [Isosphaeraceae bacterium]|nr:hypothetical protein [Isosphaeraceae bacterium]
SKKAESLLAQARALEKQSQRAAALTYYKMIVKEYPTTPPAKIAAERIKALGGR